MEQQLRQWIVAVLESHRPLVALAMRQRAKFEGWLKLELAAYALSQGASAVEVESGYAAAGMATRADVTFTCDGTRYDVELKTCNTNWRMDGILTVTRPITKNINGVVLDDRKLGNCSGQGLVAFCLFPIAPGDRRWTVYLDRIAAELGVTLSPEQHSSIVTVPLDGTRQADVVVSTFGVPKTCSGIALPVVAGS